MASVLGEINLLLFFILQHEPWGFFDGSRLLLNECDYALEEGRIGLCLLQKCLLWL